MELHLVEFMDEVLRIAMTKPLTGLLAAEQNETENTASDDAVTH